MTRLGTFGDQILLYLRSDWTIGEMTCPAGALVAADFEAYLRGDRKLAVLFRTHRAQVSGRYELNQELLDR